MIQIFVKALSGALLSAVVIHLSYLLCVATHNSFSLQTLMIYTEVTFALIVFLTILILDIRRVK